MNKQFNAGEITGTESVLCYHAHEMMTFIDSWDCQINKCCTESLV